jgi:hypothetical protein
VLARVFTAAATLLAFALLVACGEGDGASVTAPTATAVSSTAASPDDLSCAGTPGPGAGTGNVFANPGFEEGEDPWISLTTEAWGSPFSVSQAQAQDGSSSALLELRSELGGAAKVWGVVQEVSPGDLPEVVSGHYYVDRWEKGTPKQYLQLVVIVNDAANIPSDVAALRANNYQIRYLLAGAAEQPTNIANARYVFVSREEPATGQWVRFERNIRQDFCDLWGAIPRGFSSVRILFEVRYDDRPADAAAAADVYYDNLYLGPAGRAP